jgi:glycerate 2-kinase
VLEGAQVLAAETGLVRHVAAADVVLTACTTLDGTTLEIGVPAAVGRAAIDQMVPVVVVAAQVQVGRRELAGTGIEAAYPVSDPPSPGFHREDADPGASSLSQRASRVARTWSR